jgi:hypothetical protein
MGSGSCHTTEKNLPLNRLKTIRTAAQNIGWRVNHIEQIPRDVTSTSTKTSLTTKASCDQLFCPSSPMVLGCLRWGMHNGFTNHVVGEYRT